VISFRLAAVLTLVPPLGAVDAVLDLLERGTIAKIRRYERAFDGALGMAAVDLATGRHFAVNGDVLFPQASSIKIPILMRMFQAERDGDFRWSDRLTLTSKDMAGGSGRLQEELAKGPVTLTIRDLIAAMIETSDNTATNKCIDLVKMERVNRMLDEMGFLQTRLRRLMMDGGAVARGLENVSTPLEMVGIVERIFRGRVVDDKAGAEMIAIMKRVRADMRKAVPAEVEVASKPGSVPGVRCETGIVYLPHRPFAISVMSTFAKDGGAAVEEITRIVYAHFDKLARANVWGHRYR
jgi:beta-lactamase class A